MSTTTTTATTTTLTGSSQDANYIPRGPTEAKITYYDPPADGAKPYYYVEKPTDGQPQTNFGEPTITTPITDIRNDESSYTLDRDAFQVLQNITSAAEPSFTDDTDIKTTYYREVEELILKHVPGAHRVLIFDHTIRRSTPHAHRQPVYRAHIDQTAASAEQRVFHHLPAREAEELVKGRYRIINVWRPLNGPVQSNPLAFASSVSVRDEDLVGVEHRYPDRTGETAAVRHHAGQRWFYLSGVTNEERVLLKCSDSWEGAEGKRVPHTAFEHPDTPAGARGRESIEVRTLVFG